MHRFQPGLFPRCKSSRNPANAWMSSGVWKSQEQRTGRADPSWQSLKLQHQQDLESWLGLIFESNHCENAGLALQTQHFRAVPYCTNPCCTQEHQTLYSYPANKQNRVKEIPNLHHKSSWSRRQLETPQKYPLSDSLSPITQRKSLCWQMLLVTPTWCVEVKVCVWYPNCTQSFCAHYKIFN